MRGICSHLADGPRLLQACSILMDKVSRSVLRSYSGMLKLVLGDLKKKSVIDLSNPNPIIIDKTFLYIYIYIYFKLQKLVFYFTFFLLV